MKINKSILITSIAMTLVIFGGSIVLTARFGYEMGLTCGLGAFLLLISIMLMMNRRLNQDHTSNADSDAAEQDKDTMRKE